MNAPRHLWSGDWRRESDESAQRIAELRDAADAPAEPSEPPVSAAAPLRATLLQALSALRRAAAGLRQVRAPRIRPAVLLAVAMLLSAGTAFAVVASLRGQDSQQTAHQRAAAAQPSSRVRAGQAWLGIETASFAPADGAMIVSVATGSPADRAGLQPGDVITQIDNQPVQSPADLQSVLARLSVGQRVQIDFQRGPSTDTTQATVEARPAGP